MSRESFHAAADRAKFDAYASDYASIHARNVALSGEAPEYFAVYKLRCLERLVGPSFDEPVLDYGCGVGMVTRQLATRFSQVDAFDPSAESLAEARARVPAAHFHDALDSLPDERFGIIVMSGVLHHIHPNERANVLHQVTRKLRPGTGRLVIFEHNPLNPLTRRVVATCPFDDDAMLLWPWQARGLLVGGGFADVSLRFIVFLPRALARLRWLEPHLGAVPLGAQQMLVGTRPAV